MVPGTYHLIPVDPLSLPRHVIRLGGSGEHRIPNRSATMFPRFAPSGSHCRGPRHCLAEGAEALQVATATR